MSSINLLDENLVLWNRFRSGEADALAGIMKLHYNDLFNYAIRFTNDKELVKDCMQDLFLSLWKNRTTVSQTSFVKYYLLKSLRRNLFRSLGSKKKRNTIVYDDFVFENFFDSSLPVENKLIIAEDVKELAQKVNKLLARLTKREQEVIYLRFYADADIEEIAEIMGMQTQSVYNLLHKSLAKLKLSVAQKPFFFSR